MRRNVIPLRDEEHPPIILDNNEVFQPILYKNLYVPSYVHSYSLAIEYMKKWFLSYFSSTFFKYVHINGKHMFDDYKHFNKQNVKREKPLIIITPNVEFDHDREGVDSYIADSTIFLKRSNYQSSFFQDRKDNLYLGFQMKELKMTFNFRVKVSTRAQQLDLYDQMNLMFKIGGTITEYKTCEFPIPKDILLNVASDKGFEIIGGEIKYPIAFLNYLNSHSQIPIVFKLRNINQKLEYFMRLENIWCNIWLTDKLSVDDGEREGQLENNFNIDMQAVLRIAVPQFFVYFNEKPLKYRLESDTGLIGLCSLSQFQIQPVNEYGWETFLNTEYMIEPHEEYIDMNEVISGTPLERVINSLLAKGISPKTFIDIKVYREIHGEYPLVKSSMDYTTRKLELQDLPEEQYLYIVIYIDKLYFNEELNLIDKMNGRVN